jgi:excisionase family DNA binding protein
MEPRVSTKQTQKRADAHGQALVMRLWPDAGQALGLSRNATYDAARRGEIPTIRFGKLIRVPMAAFNDLLASAGQTPGVGG